MSELPPAEHVRSLAQEILADEQFARGRTDRAILDYFADLVRGINDLQSTAPVLYWAVILGLLLVLGAIFAHSAWVVYRAMGSAGVRRDLDEPGRPGHAGGAPAEVLAAARDRAAAGDFRSALPLVYLSLLLELERRELLHLEPSITNQEAVRRLRRPDLRRPASRLAGLADRALYSGKPCGDEEFRAGLQLHRQVLEATA